MTGRWSPHGEGVLQRLAGLPEALQLGSSRVPWPSPRLGASPHAQAISTRSDVVWRAAHLRTFPTSAAAEAENR